MRTEIVLEKSKWKMYWSLEITFDVGSCTFIKGKRFSPLKNKDIVQNHYTENAKYKNTSFYNVLLISTHFRITINVRISGKNCSKLQHIWSNIMPNCEYFALSRSPFHMKMRKTCPTRAYNCPKIVRIHSYQQVGHFLPIWFCFTDWKSAAKMFTYRILSHPSLTPVCKNRVTRIQRCVSHMYMSW